MAHVGPSCDPERVATNLSFEDAGATQGSADGWTTTVVGLAQEYGSFERGDGLLVAWESFSGWVPDQAEYRFAGFVDGDTTPGDLETFALWITGQDEYRFTGFESGDTSGGVTETFGTWISGMADYRFSGFEPGDTTAGDLETFALWVSGQADYRAAFLGGDTSAGTFQLGPGVTGGTETFEACRSDAVAVATPADPVISIPDHDFLDDDPVQWDSDGVPPAPFHEGVTYYLVSADVDETQIAATVAGSPITPTDAGTGTHRLIGDPSVFWRNPRAAW